MPWQLGRRIPLDRSLGWAVGPLEVVVVKKTLRHQELGEVVDWTQCEGSWHGCSLLAGHTFNDLQIMN